MRFNKRKFSASQQFEALRQSPLALGREGSLGIGRFHFQYLAQPTVLSRKYLVQIAYRQYQRPNVFVLEPDLVSLAENRKLPHVYQQSPPELCLYMPGTGEWGPDKLISKTILPWSILWLYFFENWLATDKWDGGGLHPNVDSRRKAPTSKNLRRSH